MGSVQGRFWRSFNKAVTSANGEQEFVQKMPSTVRYTITFTDEYGDEHVTSLLSVEYKSACNNDNCFVHPDFATQSLEEHAESVNQSLGALPRGAIENKYVWAVGTKYDNTGKAKELTISTSPSVKQKYYTYPKDWKAVETGNPDPESVPVDQLEYRLDTSIIDAGCKGKDITGTVATTQYGLCVFIQIENPGVQQALKVQYFYNPKTTSARANPLITHVVSGQTSGFNTKRINDASDKFATDDPLYLVTVHDLQVDRVWNPKDGDVSKLFISEDIIKLD